ncbi:MAG TPA: hypothetical protein VFJ29_07450, partial [Candidatus Kapabacteria bacterium]|nr:hypothetical protein [Candidatus Kapabacteria bacterium]
MITACCSSYAQVNPAVAQEKLPGVWSFTLDGGYNIGISPTMRGTADQFVSDVVASYNNSKYPFGDPSTTASDIGGMFSYRFPSSNFGVFFGAQYNQFFVNTDQTIYSAYFSGNTKAY